MRGLIIDAGVVVACDAPIRPLTRDEEADRDRFIAANRARAEAAPRRVVARIDEHGRDRQPPRGGAAWRQP